MTGISKDERAARTRIEEIFAAEGIQIISEEEYQELLALCGFKSRFWYLSHRRMYVHTGTIGEMCDQCFVGKTGRCKCNIASRDQQCQRCWE